MCLRKKFYDVLVSLCIFCQENELAFLDLLDILGPGFVKFSEDGSHPNAEGHKIIFEEVKKFLIESKLI